MTITRRRRGLVGVPNAFFAYARKTAPEVVNNSAVLQNDDHLVFPIGANETWHAEYVLLYDASQVADLKAQIVGPAGSTVTTMILSAQPATTSASSTQVKMTGGAGNTGPLGAAGVGTAMLAILIVLIRNGATAGNVTLQWSQNTAEVSDCTLQTDSHVTARKVA